MLSLIQWLNPKLSLLVVDSMDDFDFEGFGIVFVCHVAGYDALEQVFVDASGGNVVNTLRATTVRH